MKNQYFGDIYDYFKYGLLRRLSCHGRISTSVCWMLTDNDDRKDGHRVSYLEEPATWRHLDPFVYDCLRAAVLNRKERHVRVVERSRLLPNATFYPRLLPDASGERISYFDGFLEFARGKELVFFDPDNGLEIKSVKYGRKGAARYLFHREVSQSFKAGHSLLIYQHMPPKPRDPLIRDLASGLLQETGSQAVHVFRTPRVAFFLVPQTSQIGWFAKTARKIQTDWSDVLDTERYPA